MHTETLHQLAGDCARFDSSGMLHVVHPCGCRLPGFAYMAVLAFLL
jgi:hypothetical protein